MKLAKKNNVGHVHFVDECRAKCGAIGPWVTGGYRAPDCQDCLKEMQREFEVHVGGDGIRRKTRFMFAGQPWVTVCLAPGTWIEFGRHENMCIVRSCNEPWVWLCKPASQKRMVPHKLLTRVVSTIIQANLIP